MAHLTDDEGYEKIDDNWIFYAKITGTEEYAVLALSDVEAMGYYFSNRTMMVVILLFSCIFLVLLYIIFSNRMTEPVPEGAGGHEAGREWTDGCTSGNRFS